MSDTAATEAARQLVAKRWGSRKPVRLARELELRAHESPDAERQQLLDALTRRTDQDVTHG